MRKGEAILFRQDEPVILESNWIPEYTLINPRPWSIDCILFETQ